MTKRTAEQQRLLNKKRLIAKIEQRTRERSSYISRLNTHIKDFYGMLKTYVNSLTDKYKHNMPQKISICINMIKNEHINVFRREISKLTFTAEQVQQKIRDIHKLAQTLISKKILNFNQVTNIMQKVNNVYKTILIQEV